MNKTQLKRSSFGNLNFRIRKIKLKKKKLAAIISTLITTMMFTSISYAYDGEYKIMGEANKEINIYEDLKANYSLGQGQNYKYLITSGDMDKNNPLKIVNNGYGLSEQNTKVGLHIVNRYGTDSDLFDEESLGNDHPNYRIVNIKVGDVEEKSYLKYFGFEDGSFVGQDYGIDNVKYLNLNFNNLVLGGNLIDGYGANDFEITQEIFYDENDNELTVGDAIVKIENSTLLNSVARWDLSSDNIDIEFKNSLIGKTDNNNQGDMINFVGNNRKNINFKWLDTAVLGKGDIVRTLDNEYELTDTKYTLDLEFEASENHPESKVNLHFDNSNVEKNKVFHGILMKNYGDNNYYGEDSFIDGVFNNAKFQNFQSRVIGRVNYTFSSDNNKLFNGLEEMSEDEISKWKLNRERQVGIYSDFNNPEKASFNKSILNLYDGNGSVYKLINQGFKSDTSGIKDENGRYLEYIDVTKISSYISINNSGVYGEGADNNEKLDIENKIELSGVNGTVNPKISLGPIIGTVVKKPEVYADISSYEYNYDSNLNNVYDPPFRFGGYDHEGNRAPDEFFEAMNRLEEFAYDINGNYVGPEYEKVNGVYEYVGGGGGFTIDGEMLPFYKSSVYYYNLSPEFKEGKAVIDITNDFNGELTDLLFIDKLNVLKGQVELKEKQYDIPSITVNEGSLLKVRGDVEFKLGDYNFIENWKYNPVTDEDEKIKIYPSSWESNFHINGKMAATGSGNMEMIAYNSSFFMNGGVLDLATFTNNIDSGTSVSLKLQKLDSTNGKIIMGAYLDNSKRQSDHLAVRDVFGKTKLEVVNRASEYKMLDDGGIELVSIEGAADNTAIPAFYFEMDSFLSVDEDIEYFLEKRDNKWFIVSTESTGNITPSNPVEQLVIEIPGPNVFVPNMRGTVNSVRDRMNAQKIEKDGSYFWMKGINVDYKLSPLKSKTNLVQMGLDKDMGDGLLAGLFLDYGDTKFKHPMVNGTATGYGLGVYASQSFNNGVFVDGVFRGLTGHVKYDSYQGKHNVNGYTLDLTLGKKIERESFNISPFVGVSHNKVNGFILNESDKLKWSAPDSKFNETKAGFQIEFAKNSFKPTLTVSAINTNGLADKNGKKSFTDGEIKFGVNKEYKNLQLNGSINSRFGTIKETDVRIGVTYKW